MEEEQANCLEGSCSLDLAEQEMMLLHKYLKLSSAEESFVRQKARIKWLCFGDRNTKFFHQKVKSHRMYNNILSLMMRMESVLF